MTYVASVGAGAFKATFKAILPTGEPVALKVYRPGFSIPRTAREVEALSRCNHPNIASLLSIEQFVCAGTSYLVSTEEMLEGGTLTRMLAQGLLARPAVLSLGSALIEAVAHVANLALVHRDIKPDNIMFRADRTTPVLVDFGLVRDLRADSITQTWLMQGPGTPLYAPAEQLRNDKELIDWRSDQFSLGVSLSYAAFGVHPFQEDGEAPQDFLPRVAERKEPSAKFIQLAKASQLSALVTMVRPWPIERYRTPDMLKSQWSLQKGD
jgi:serine/threonine protein kinase